MPADRHCYVCGFQEDIIGFAFCDICSMTYCSYCFDDMEIKGRDHVCDM